MSEDTGDLLDTLLADIHEVAEALRRFERAGEATPMGRGEGSGPELQWLNKRAALLAEPCAPGQTRDKAFDWAETIGRAWLAFDPLVRGAYLCELEADLAKPRPWTQQDHEYFCEEVCCENGLHVCAWHQENIGEWALCPRKHALGYDGSDPVPTGGEEACSE